MSKMVIKGSFSPLAENEDILFAIFMFSFEPTLVSAIKCDSLRSTLIDVSMNYDWQTDAKIWSFISKWGPVVMPKAYFGNKVLYIDGKFQFIHGQIKKLNNIAVDEAFKLLETRDEIEAKWPEHRLNKPIYERVKSNPNHLKHLMAYKYMRYAINNDIVGIIHAFKTFHDDYAACLLGPDNTLERIKMGAAPIAIQESILNESNAINGCLQCCVLTLLFREQIPTLVQILTKYRAPIFKDHNTRRYEFYLMPTNFTRYLRTSILRRYLLYQNRITPHYALIAEPDSIEEASDIIQFILNETNVDPYHERIINPALWESFNHIGREMGINMTHWPTCAYFDKIRAESLSGNDFSLMAHDILIDALIEQ